MSLVSTGAVAGVGPPGPTGRPVPQGQPLRTPPVDRLRVTYEHFGAGAADSQSFVLQYLQGTPRGRSGDVVPIGQLALAR
jgi:hypothetical protein